METCVDVKVLNHDDAVEDPMPIIWVHGGGYLLCARKGQADLWHVETRQRRSILLPEGE